jgi:Zn-dependent alcohol dehydrogenase
VVVAAGSSVGKVAPGDQVLLSFTSCGCCAACRNGHPAYCETWVPRNLIAGARDDGTATVHRDGQALGGCFFGQSSFATYALADERSVVKVAGDAPLHVLAPLGCRGVASSIDTTAVPAVLRTAVDALGIRGCCAVIGAPPQGTEVSFEVQSLLPGKRIVGVTLGDTEPETLIPQLAALHRAGRLPLEKLIRYYPLAGLDDAARDMREGTAIKPVIRFPEED